MIKKELLQFIHDRLLAVHGEQANIDYMHRLREIIENIEKADEEIRELQKTIHRQKVTILVLYEIIANGKSLSDEVNRASSLEDKIQMIGDHFGGLL